MIELQESILFGGLHHGKVCPVMSCLRTARRSRHLLTDEWPAHPPVAMWFNGSMINDFMREWLIRMDEKRAGLITKDEFFEWKLNWPDTCDDCGKFEPKKQWRKAKEIHY